LSAKPDATDVRAPSAGAEWLRRLLLGAVTALIVARPLVLGEDPGLLLRPWSDATGLVLMLLWLITGLGWAVWRAWSGQASWVGGAVEGGLLAVVALVFVSAWPAAYQHPAWLIAWEWLALLVAFCLVRQLPRAAADNPRLLAAVLASAVSLSAYAIYQYAWEFPQMRQQLGSDEALRNALTQQGIEFGSDANYLRNYHKRIEFDHVFATFSHPNSFSGYLALVFPAAIGWAWAAGQGRQKRWLTALAVAAAGLLGAALWLTHSRGAILGTLLALAAIGVVRGRRWLWSHKAAALASIAVLAAGLFLVNQRAGDSEGVEKSRRSLGLRRDYWAATWRMITDGQHPRFFWLGVGPGNFGNYYPRYMTPTAFEEVKDPHNFALDMWATSGVFALTALLFALGAFFRRAWVVVQGDENSVVDAAPPTSGREFYLGGMAGLVLGFALWASAQTGENAADAILIGGLVAAGRSLLWFAAFALFERIPWTGAARALALVTGIVALLLNLCVSGGIAFPSVALFLWVLVALALNALPQPAPRWQPHPWLGAAVPMAVLAVAGLVYYHGTFAPVTGCTASLEEARKHYGDYQKMFAAIGQEKSPDDQRRLAFGAVTYLQRRILPPLVAAAKADPNDAYAQTELAHWYGQEWRYRPLAETRDAALDHAKRAIQLDPQGREGYLARSRLYDLFAQQPDSKAAAFRASAAKDLFKVVEQVPTSAALRYQLADFYFRAGDAVAGREQARKAQELDGLSTEPTRQLTDPQRRQIRQWLGLPAAGSRLLSPGGGVTIYASSGSR
jgi:hypothetical protein